MKILLRVFLLCILVAVTGCEGMVRISPKYQPTGTVNCVTQGRPVIELQVRDERVKKVFHRSPGFGDITEDGRGGPYKLAMPTRQIVEQAFSTALRACNYEIKDKSQIVYRVDIEEFLLTQHKPDDPIFGIDSKQETNIVLNITVISSERSLAWKRFVRKDTAKFLSEQDIVEKMFSQSLTAVVEEALEEQYFANVIIVEHTKMSNEWRMVASSNTEYAYEDYIRKYPNSTHIDEARNKIVELNWGRTLAANTEHSYRDFISKYPNSPYAGEAGNKIVELSWARALATDTERAYQDFIANYPQSPHVGEAKKKIDAPKWEKALATNTTEAYKDFLKRYPNSAFEKQAKDRIEAIRVGEAVRAAEKQKRPFRTGMTIELTLNLDYERPEQSYVSLPGKSDILTKQYNAIKGSGFEIVGGANTGQSEASMVVDITATPRGAQYQPQGYLYTGGNADGTMTIKIGAKQWKKKFHSSDSPEFVVMIPNRGKALFDPFSSPSIVAMYELVYSVWGLTPLIEALEQIHTQDNALKALKKITKQDFGSNADKWRQWLK